MEVDQAVARRGRVAMAWWAGAAVAAGATFASTTALDRTLEPASPDAPIAADPTIAAIAGATIVGVLGAGFAIWASWTWLVYRRLARRASPIIGTLHVWRTVQSPDRVERFSGALSGRRTTSRVRQHLGVGTGDAGEGPRCRLGLGLGVSALDRGVYPVGLVGDVAPRRRVIVVTDSEVLLPPWPTRKLRPRHGTPAADLVRRSFPAGWRPTSDVIGGVARWQAAVLGVAGLAGVIGAAWLATTTAPVLAVFATLASWALVAVALAAAATPTSTREEPAPVG